MSEKITIDSREKGSEQKYIGRITLLRHGQTEYKDIYPDLTEEGKDTIRRAAEQIAVNLKNDEDVMIVSSPKARARGTADIVRAILHHDSEVRMIPGITSMATRDPEKAMDMINEFLADDGIMAVDYAYTHDSRFDEKDIWEPRDEIQKRFLRNLEYAIRGFKRIAKHAELPKPHLIAVTHFEVLSPLLSDIFQLKYPEEPTLKHGELVEIDAYDLSLEGENSDILLLKIHFREKTRSIGFDRRNRKIILLENT